MDKKTNNGFMDSEIISILQFCIDLEVDYEDGIAKNNVLPPQTGWCEIA